MFNRPHRLGQFMVRLTSYRKRVSVRVDSDFFRMHGEFFTEREESFLGFDSNSRFCFLISGVDVDHLVFGTECWGCVLVWA